MPTPTELSDRLLAKLAGWEAMKEARTLLAAGRVAESSWSPPILTGLVREGNSTLRAGLVIRSDTDADNLCPCRTSRQRGLICAHSIAIGLHTLSPTPPPAAPAPAVPTPPAPPTTPPANASTPPPKGRTFTRASAPSGAEPLAITVILPPTLPDAIARGRLTVHFEGQWRKGTAPLASLPLTQPFLLDPPDTALLDVIESLSGGDTPSLLQLDPHGINRLFTAAISHPRIFLGKSRRIDVLSDPARLSIQARLQDNGDILIQCASPLPPGGPSPLNPWRLLPEGLQRVLLPDPLRHAPTSPQRITRDLIPAFLSESWPSLVATCDLDADFTPEDFELLLAEPSIHLHLTGGMAMLDARLQAAYGPQSFVPGTQKSAASPWLPDPSHPRRYRVRNLDAEQAAAASLIRAGFTTPDPHGISRLRGEESILNFFTRDLPRLQRSWQITLDDRLSHSTQRHLDPITTRCEIRAPSQDWFDLAVVHETSSGERLDPTEVQRLLRSGHGRTRLPNSKWAILDTSAVEELDQVLTDANPRQESGRYRLDAAQAGFLHATLHSLPGCSVRAPDSWNQRASRANGQASLTPPDLGPLNPILRTYQKDGVAWLRLLRTEGFGGVLADDMGLGKTLQVLTHLELLRTAGQLHQPALVIAPTSLLTNWAAEAARFTPQLKTLVLHGADRHAHFPALANHHLVITSYALARLDLPQLATHHFDTVILDEAQHIKNPGTQNAQSVKSIPAQHRLVLTGTPVENSVRDLWSLFDFLMPGYLGSARDFRDRYEDPIMKARDTAVRDRLTRRLRPFLLRRLKRDVAADLPPRIEQVCLCDLNPDQQAAYTQILEAGRSEILASAGEEHLPQNRLLVLTLLLRLRQVACDLRLLRQPDDPHPAEAAPASGKLVAFTELLEESLDGGHRILVFSQFTTMLGLLRTELDQRQIPCCYLDGATRNRAAEIERFQRNPSVPIFLISLKAGGTGLNLTGADTVIHFDPWWNPAVEAQATDRAHRIGQKRVVTSYKLVARGTVEEKILQLQQRKGALSRNLLGDEESLAASLSWEEINSLLQDT